MKRKIDLIGIHFTGMSFVEWKECIFQNKLTRLNIWKVLFLRMLESTKRSWSIQMRNDIENFFNKLSDRKNSLRCKRTLQSNYWVNKRQSTIRSKIKRQLYHLQLPLKRIILMIYPLLGIRLLRMDRLVQSFLNILFKPCSKHLTPINIKHLKERVFKISHIFYRWEIKALILDVLKEKSYQKTKRFGLKSKLKRKESRLKIGILQKN